VAGKKAVGFGDHESEVDVDEQRAGGTALLSGGGEMKGSFSGALMPVAADQVSDSKQRFPDFGGAITEVMRDFGVGLHGSSFTSSQAAWSHAEWASSSDIFSAVPEKFNEAASPNRRPRFAFAMFCRFDSLICAPPSPSAAVG